MTWHLPHPEDEIRDEIVHNQFQTGHRDRMTHILQSSGRPLRSAADVGAHVGVWTRWMLGLFDRVHAFEIVPEVRSCWRLNIQDARASLYDHGLGAEEGTVRVTWDATRSVNTWVGQGQDLMLIRPMDDITFDHLDYIKMDVEGYELSVLQGAERTIDQHRPIIHMEMKLGALARQGLDKHTIRRWLQARGYDQTHKFATEFVFEPSA